ncbi:MAG: sigma-70 family RNA polymerase sigma factor [Draconibacterium sp.]
MPGIEKSEFIGLFNQLYRPVRNYIYYKTGDNDVADDIAQETFSKIWEKKETIRVETAKQLAYTIANNLCKNRFDHERVVLEFANSYKPGGNENSPEFEMEMNEFNERLNSAINGLNDKSRVVFLMNRIDGLTYNEIAKTLDLSVKAIEKRMKNALDELKKSIEFKL